MWCKNLECEELEYQWRIGEALMGRRSYGIWIHDGENEKGKTMGELGELEVLGDISS